MWLRRFIMSVCCLFSARQHTNKQVTNSTPIYAVWMVCVCAHCALLSVIPMQFGFSSCLPNTMQKKGWHTRKHISSHSLKFTELKSRVHIFVCAHQFTIRRLSFAIHFTSIYLLIKIDRTISAGDSCWSLSLNHILITNPYSRRVKYTKHYVCSHWMRNRHIYYSLSFNLHLKNARIPFIYAASDSILFKLNTLYNTVRYVHAVLVTDLLVILFRFFCVFFSFLVWCKRSLKSKNATAKTVYDDGVRCSAVATAAAARMFF